MRPFKLVIFLLLAFMVVVTFSQRGGGGGGGSRGGRGKGNIFKTLFGSAEEQQECKLVNGKKKCKKKQEELSVWAKIGVFGVVAVYAIYEKINQTNQETQAQLKQQARITEYQTTHRSESAYVASSQKQAIIAQFKRMKYSITLSTKDKSDTFICQLSDIQLQEQDQHKYKIKMRGKDDVGRSYFRGMLMFKGGGLRMLLSKQYAIKKKAGQTGKYRVLLYQGQGTAQKIQGQWAFVGFQNTPKYSGEWTMTQAKNQ